MGAQQAQACAFKMRHITFAIRFCFNSVQLATGCWVCISILGLRVYRKLEKKSPSKKTLCVYSVIFKSGLRVYKGLI